MKLTHLGHACLLDLVAQPDKLRAALDSRP